jgi:hypothetical protein
MISTLGKSSQTQSDFHDRDRPIITNSFTSPIPTIPTLFRISSGMPRARAKSRGKRSEFHQSPKIAE